MKKYICNLICPGQTTKWLCHGKEKQRRTSFCYTAFPSQQTYKIFSHSQRTHHIIKDSATTQLPFKWSFNFLRNHKFRRQSNKAGGLRSNIRVAKTAGSQETSLSAVHTFKNEKTGLKRSYHRFGIDWDWESFTLTASSKN